MPVLATQNIKNEEIFNCMEFKIDEISDDEFKINNKWFDRKTFADVFIPAFCTTVYKFQGMDINQPLRS